MAPANECKPTIIPMTPNVRMITNSADKISPHSSRHRRCNKIDMVKPFFEWNSRFWQQSRLGVDRTEPSCRVRPDPRRKHSRAVPYWDTGRELVQFNAKTARRKLRPRIVVELDFLGSLPDSLQTNSVDNCRRMHSTVSQVTECRSGLSGRQTCSLLLPTFSNVKYRGSLDSIQSLSPELLAHPVPFAQPSQPAKQHQRHNLAAAIRLRSIDTQNLADRVSANSGFVK